MQEVPAVCERLQPTSKEYLDWLARNPNGFVFRDFPGQRILHRAPCTQLRRDTDASHGARYTKICCTREECILQTLSRLYGAEGRGWYRCQAERTGCWA